MVKKKKKPTTQPELANPELDNPELDNPELDKDEPIDIAKSVSVLIPQNFTAITADIVLSVINNRTHLQMLALQYATGQINKEELQERVKLSLQCVSDLYEKIQEFAGIVSEVMVEAHKRWE